MGTTDRNSAMCSKTYFSQFKKSSVYQILLLSLAFHMHDSLGAEVKIQNVAETIILESGVEQDFICVVSGEDLQDGIIWTVGERQLNTDSLLVETDGQFQQTLTYLPRIEDNEENIKCQSGSMDNKVRLIIFQQEILYMSWVENRKDKLVLAAKLYPHPTPQDVLWNITTATGFVVTLKPGEKESDFSAEIIEKDADYPGIYKFTLTIANISDENIPASVSISLKSLSETRVETFQLMPQPVCLGCGVTPILIWLCVGSVFCVIITSLVITVISCIKMFKGEGDPIIGVKNAIAQSHAGYQKAETQFFYL